MPTDTGSDMATSPKPASPAPRPRAPKPVAFPTDDGVAEEALARLKDALAAETA
jgi:hypothetical protein